MSYGCPVLSSKSTCLPEVGGDAALYFNPELPGTLVELMEKVMDESTREQLVQRGFERVGIYSWNKMAASTKFAYSS
jgi:glycosyltransferase involved in cell wall biosynthesis